MYGQSYSKSSISRMVESVRSQVNEWLERRLESYYPVVFIDCVHIKIHRKSSVANEAFYVALAITTEGKREVLGIFNLPTESATGWGDTFDRQELASDLKDIFRTNQRDYGIEQAWDKWQQMCQKWERIIEVLRR